VMALTGLPAVVESPALIHGVTGRSPSDSDLGGFVGPPVVDASDSIPVEPAPFQVGCVSRVETDPCLTLAPHCTL
jgi:hypothetical protein